MVRRFKWIVVDPNVRHGKPMFRGTRVLVSDVLEMLASGMTIEEVLEEYPQLTREMILEALALAAELLKRGRRVIPLPA
ncbi:MAG: antitoxin [Candidatus Altiarchaeales archaeon]|nr:MAG: antitoxin [Candidatus Altiarchaeales archaeon]